MALSRDDDRIQLDAFAAEEKLSIRDLGEDQDPMAAFAAEQALAQPEARAARSAVTAETPLRLMLARPAQRGFHVNMTAVALVAAVLAIAAGAYVYPLKLIPRVQQIAAREDAPAAVVGADADAAAVASTEVVVAAPADSETNPPAAAPPARDNSSHKRTVPVPALRPKPVTSPLPEAKAAAAGTGGTLDGSAPLSGAWVMNTRVESSRLKRYEGLQLGYRVNLRQDGNRISGTGWKVSEDERTIGTTAQTPITLDGEMNGDRVELTFTEQGRRRVSAGKLVLARDSDDVLRGRFSSSAARSLGVVEIRR